MAAAPLSPLGALGVNQLKQRSKSHCGIRLDRPNHLNYQSVAFTLVAYVP
jgi:hypothetical protein